jgi:hypothetical protein
VTIAPNQETKPWETEPTEKSFDHAGCKCQMRRGPGLHWCGYVGIPDTHPMHGKGSGEPLPILEQAFQERMKQPIGESPSFAVLLAMIGDEPKPTAELVLNVHGGITYTENHAPRQDPDGFWWFGFDCAHAGDLSPKYGDFGDGVYRDMAYVEAECRSLAEQLDTIAKGVLS